VVEPADCIRDGEEALRIARQIDWRAGEANALVYLAFGHGPRGEYRLAIEQAQAALAVAREIDSRVWVVGARVALGVIALDLLALDSARQHLEACRADAREVGAFLGQIVAGLLATVYVAQNDLAAAELLIGSILSPGTSMETRGQRLAWAAQAELALAARQAARAQEIAERLLGASAGRSAASIPRLG